MKKIYLVTAGQYSDYQVLAVYSKQVDAKALVNKIKNSENTYFSDSVDIEEYFLDVPIDKDEWIVRMDFNFNVIDIDKCNDYGYDVEELATENIDINGNFYTICLAKNKKHAIKVASERLTRYKAIRN